MFLEASYLALGRYLRLTEAYLTLFSTGFELLTVPVSPCVFLFGKNASGS